MDGDAFEAIHGRDEGTVGVSRPALQGHVQRDAEIVRSWQPTREPADLYGFRPVQVAREVWRRGQQLLLRVSGPDEFVAGFLHPEKILAVEHPHVPAAAAEKSLAPQSVGHVNHRRAAGRLAALSGTGS